MTKAEKKIVGEVLEAMTMHYAVIGNNVTHNARISKATLRDMEEGMAISIDKLQRLIK